MSTRDSFDPFKPQPWESQIRPSGESLSASRGPVLKMPAVPVPGQSEIADLLDATGRWIKRYVSATDAQVDIICLFVLYTYAADKFDCAPYLQITSAEKRCGKTRLLETLELLVYMPWSTARTSAAALVRTLNDEHPTLLLDESDAAFGGDKQYSEALRNVLNAGHRRGAKVTLCVGKGSDQKPTKFDVFGPKVIAGIGKLPSTVADRSIPIKLERKTSAEKLEPFRLRIVRPQVAPLQKMLATWATAERLRHLEDAFPSQPASLSDRQQDVSEPLLAIAEYAGNDWGKRARNALVELFRHEVAADDSLGVRLLRDIKIILGDADRISSMDLCRELNEKEASPWPQFHDGRGVSPADVARVHGAQ